MIRSTAIYLAIGLIAFQSSVYFLNAHGAEPQGMPLVVVPALQLLANDKEAQSRLILPEDLLQAEKDLGNIDRLRPQLESLASELAEVVFGKAPVCEISTLAAVQKKASDLGITSDPQSLKSVLVALRQSELMDDLTLFPLLHTLPSYLKLPAEDVTRPGAPLACPSDVLAGFAGSLRSEKGRSYKRRLILKKIRSEVVQDKISPWMENWLTSLYQSKVDTLPFTLSGVAAKIQFVKDTATEGGQKNHSSSYASRQKKKAHGLTERMALYSKYSGIQIEKLSQVFYRFNHRMGAKSAEIRVSFDDAGTDTEVRILRPEEQYRMAKKWLHVEIVDDLKQGKDFEGKTIDYGDVVLAGLETGLIAADTVETVLKVEDIWNPKIPEWKKIVGVVVKVGGPASILVPFPFNAVSSVAMLIVQNYVINDKTPKQPDDVGTSLF